MTTTKKSEQQQLHEAALEHILGQRAEKPQMVTKRADNGMLYEEPPYTDKEITAFFETCGTVTLVGTTRPRGTQRAQAPKSLRQPRAKPRRVRRRRAAGQPSPGRSR